MEITFIYILECGSTFEGKTWIQILGYYYFLTYPGKAA